MRHDYYGQSELDVIKLIEAHYQGHIVANMAYSADEANHAIDNSEVSAVAFGVPYIANPDLVERFRQSSQLNTPDPKTFYSPGPKGYTDYPCL
jgi:N-ethylmaleimide reductase